MKLLEAQLKWNMAEIHTRPAQWIRYIVIHHTAGNPDTPPEVIHQWHLQKKWGGCGYHYLVYRDGAVYKARRNLWVPACVQGHNRASLCVALVGDFSRQPPEPEHLKTAAELCRILRMVYPDTELRRHRDLFPTSCPGDAFPWDAFLREVT
jgi:N-acetyl-anhydromuramyl-L-alanine amidase AmpD